MKLNRSKNAIRNVSYGIVNKIIGIIFPFIVRTVFIRTLGAEFLGLNSFFLSILTVLNLTELGFSSAVVFCMYDPIARDDTNAINALLYFYKKIYRYIGFIILAIGLMVVPFLQKLISGSYPNEINLTIAYLIYLLNTVLSYFMYAYLQSLISAFQREDVLSKVNIVIQSIMYIIQILVLLYIKNYYIYILIMPIFTIINNIRLAYIAKKMFPQYKPIGKITYKQKAILKEKISGLVINKICVVSRNAFDSIFISMFLGLIDTAIYNNYYYIMNSISMITCVFVNSIVAGIGNSISLDSPEKNYEDMQKMNFIYLWICGWFTACLLSLYQPFMILWVGNKLLYPFSCVILICAYFYIQKMSDMRYAYELAKGLWWENRYRSIMEAIANLILNYFLGKYFGVYGIIVATLISLFFINFLYGTKIIFKYYFVNNDILAYFYEQFKYAMVTVCVCILTYFICSIIPNGSIEFIYKIVLCAVFPNIFYWLFYKNSKVYRLSINWLISRLPKTKKQTKYKEGIKK